MAGGGVLDIVTGKNQSEAYDKSDIDLLLYGLQPDELVPKVASLIEQIKAGVRMSTYWRSSSINTSATKTLVVKGFNAITIVPPLYATNRRKVQIILQHHASIFEALAWFDLDACAMGYTGSAVVALPRAVRSLSFSSDASGGINFLDPWTARKGDPTGNMLASRAIKYMSRGFSLALSPVAATAIAAQGQDFDSALTKAMLASAASTPSAPVFGLGGLKRREDFASAALAQKREARREERHGGCYDREAFNRKHFGDDSWDYGRGAYYGRFKGRARHFQRLDEDTMDSADNQQIHEEFWQYNLVDLDRALVGLVSQVGRVAKMFDQETFEEKYISDGTAKPFRDLAVPYISTFDARSALGYRVETPSQTVPGPGGNVVSNAGILASTQLSAVQYIVRLPRSLLPVIDKAEEKMRILLHQVRTGTHSAAAQAPFLSPMFPPSADQIIAMAATTLKNHPRGPSLSAHIEVPRAKPLERFLPDSFPGPARRGTNVSLAADHKLAADQKDSYAVHHLLTPLVGDESSAFDMSRKYVYRVAAIAGLWQFRGLGDDIDEALNIVWQAWTIFSHAAATMPELPTSVHKRLTLAEKLKERDIRDEHVTQLHGSATADPKDFKQPDTITTVAALHASLTTLAQAASRGRDTRVPVTAGPGHHWSGDRLRWLLQWVSNKEMV